MSFKLMLQRFAWRCAMFLRSLNYFSIFGQKVDMPANRNALIRYKTIDNCLRNPYRRWTLDDLVEACSEALYEYEGIDKGISRRTVQMDIQVMRSEKLGYNAPIEVYENKYYRYAESDYTITRLPLSRNDIEVLSETVNLLRQFQDFDYFSEMADVIGRLQDSVAVARHHTPAVIDFERNKNLIGLGYLNPIYDAIVRQQTLHLRYRSFNSRTAKDYYIYPYLLKEYRNRWFVFGARVGDRELVNLALDRIKELLLAPEIPYYASKDFHPETFFEDVIGVTKHERLSKATIRFKADNRQSSYIRTKPLHASQTLIEQCEDGSMIFEITVVLNPELYTVLMGFGPGVKVLSPEKVVVEMRRLYQEEAENYKKLR